MLASGSNARSGSSSPKERSMSPHGSPSSSSFERHPDHAEEASNNDGDSGKDDDEGGSDKSSILLSSAASTTASSASKSRKRKRSSRDPNASRSSSEAWNPNRGSDEDSGQRGGSEDLPSQLPSQIDIAISSNNDSAVAAGNISANDNDNASLNEDKINPIEIIESSQSRPTKPPERIRYEMLGAPTLLYRHAPSYLDPSNRPSTLTPQQLSMALYMNEHPIKDWFADKEQPREMKRRAKSTRSALLTSTYVPQPARPWGRAHDWDWRHAGRRAARSRAVEIVRRQARLDANDLAEELHCMNRARARTFWEEVGERNRVELSLPAPITNRRHGNVTGFNAFCVEYINRLKQSTSNSEVSSSGPQHHFRLACKAWNELPRKDQLGFNHEAEKLTLHASKRKNGESEGHEENDRKKSHGSKKKRSRKGRRTGFNIFLSEYLQSNAPAADAANADRKSHLMTMQVLAGSEWKKMTEVEKSSYTDKAKVENEKRDEQTPTEESSYQHSDPTGELIKAPMSKRKTSGFQTFRSEYTLQWKESNRNATAAERQVSMINCCKEASADWKKMSTDQKLVYHQKAKVKNGERAGQSTAEPKQKSQKNGRKGMTTGFNVFRSKSMNSLRESIPLSEGASAADRMAQFKQFTKQTSAVWKGMSDAEKSPYKEDAEKQNKLLSLSLVGNARDDLNLDHTVDIASARRNKTNSNAAVYSSKRLGHSSAGLVGERLDFKSMVGDFPPEFDSTDICGYFSPFRTHDVGIGFHLGDDVPLESIGMERKEGLFPVKESKTHSGDENSENGAQNKEASKMKDDELSTEIEADKDQLQGLDSEDVQNESISEDFCEDRHGVGGPSGYGNCLITVPCGCQYCESQSTSWFLIHPAGDYMSCVAMSKLQFPRESSLCGGQERQKVDVGARILQIVQCGNTGSQFKPTQTLCLVVRTSLYCSVIHVSLTPKPSTDPAECSAEFHMHENTRIDLLTPFGSLQTSYLPVYATCDPTAIASFFTCPSFAILSRDYSGNCTTIHQVSLREEPDVKSYSLSSSLSDCSLIEFDPQDRQIMWAAARSKAMPKLSSGFFKARNGTVTGYGHSLFRIDLRNNCAHHVWSPSHADHLTEGLHSINGIMPDHSREHVVWVSSSSACKVWALDVRYKSAKVVVSWSLPSLCDDYGPQMTPNGIYGGGVLMCQPRASHSPIDHDLVSTQQFQPPVMFSLKKDPNSFAVNVHQFPSTMPRFQAKPVELAGFQEVPKLKYEASSIARSSIFPLPDVSSSIFNIGLASLQCVSKAVLNKRQLNQVGYQIQPANVTLLITMTSLGDIYCHSLLETNSLEGTQACQFPGLPVGTKANPIPPGKKEKVPGAPDLLRLSLSNEFPVPSSAITAHAVRKIGDCCSFKSFDIGCILTENPLPNTECVEGDDDSEINYSGTNLSSLSKTPRPVSDLIKSKKALKQATWTLSNDENVEAFRVASHGIEDGEHESTINLVCGAHTQVPIQHPIPRFGLAPEKDAAATANKRHSCPITLRSGHVRVAVRKEEDEYDLESSSDCSDKRPNKEIGLHFLNKLKSNFFADNATDQIGAKTEWSSDSE